MHSTDSFAASKWMRDFAAWICRRLADCLLLAVPFRRKGYLDWVASSEGPRSVYYLKRFKPPLPVLFGLRLRHALSAERPACRGSRYLFIPPSSRVKARALSRYAARFGLLVFVETGTYRGDTVAAIASQFDRCVTIELSEDLWKSACARLSKLSNVSCLFGNSSVLLPKILRDIDAPALFWLDAHASAATPPIPARAQFSMSWPRSMLTPLKRMPF